MDTGPPPPPPPPPPLFAFETTTNTTIPHMSYTATTATNNTVSSHNNSLLIITTLVVCSAIIVSAFVCLFFRKKPPNDVVSQPRNQQHIHRHIISTPHNNVQQQPLDWLPVFTFASITGTNKQLDCAVCLSIFEAKDRLKRLPCFHAFHVECIDAWIKHNQTCPLCRSGINLTEQANILNETINETVVNNSPSDSFSIEIGTISRRLDLSDSDSSYSFGSVEHVVDVHDSFDIPVESTHRISVSDDKDEPLAGGSGNWLREYLDRGSGRWFAESSRRSETVDDIEANHGGIGVEISELFRWVSGV